MQIIYYEKNNEFKIKGEHSKECNNIITNNQKNGNNCIIDDYEDFIKSCEDSFNKQKKFEKKIFYNICIDIYNSKKWHENFLKIKYILLLINGKIIILNLQNIISLKINIPEIKIYI